MICSFYCVFPYMDVIFGFDGGLEGFPVKNNSQDHEDMHFQTKLCTFVAP